MFDNCLYDVMALESDYLDWLRQQLLNGRKSRLGLSDDAALLKPTAGSEVVVTADLLCDGVHFRLDETTPEKIGWKALQR